MLHQFQSSFYQDIMPRLAMAPTVAVLPTGGGKTMVGAEIARAFVAAGRRVWFIAHRKEIVAHVSRTLDQVCVKHQVVGWARAADPTCNLLAMMISKVPRLCESVPLPDLVVWDECHHVPAREWRKARSLLTASKHLGLTATPCRLDGRGLAPMFSEIAVGASTRELIAEGRLSPYRIFAPDGFDASDVAMSAGEFRRDLLVQKVEGSTLTGDAVDHYLRIAKGRQALAFNVSIAASRDLVARMRARGISAAHVDGQSSPRVRASALQQMASGDLSVLSSVDLFTEGLDIPAVGAILMLRPTASFTLYRQMIGRGLRHAAGKADVVILDHAGNVFRHGLPDEDVTWTLEGLTPKVAGGRELFRCPVCSGILQASGRCPSCDVEAELVHREVKQVGGYLREIKTPEGCITLAEFGRRTGVSHASAVRWARNGLPMREGFVDWPPAKAWFETSDVAAGVRRKRAEGMSVKAFAHLVGYNASHIQRLVGFGLPVNPNGKINPDLAKPFVEEWRRTRGRHKDDVGLTWKVPKSTAVSVGETKGETVDACIERLNLKCSRDRAVSAGIPLNEHGRVEGGRLADWLASNPQAGRMPILPNMETVATFLQRIGVWPRGNARKAALKRGLPVLPSGFVDIDAGLKWASETGYQPVAPRLDT